MYSDDNVPLLSFKESDSVTIAVILENGGFRPEPAYATQIIIDFDERLDFTKKYDMVIKYFFTIKNLIINLFIFARQRNRMDLAVQ